MANDALLLDNQFCFRFYTVSRLIVKHYQPYLTKLGITYPQYLVLLVLWERLAKDIPSAMANTVSEDVKQHFINCNAEAKKLLDRMIAELL